MTHFRIDPPGINKGDRKHRSFSRHEWTGTKLPNKQVRSIIGIVLVSHGRLGAEFRAALEHVAGPQKQIESVAIGPDDDIEERRQDIISAITKVDDGAGVVVLTDMFGGTPSNLAISFYERLRRRRY